MQSSSYRLLKFIVFSPSRIAFIDSSSVCNCKEVDVERSCQDGLRFNSTNCLLKTTSNTAGAEICIHILKNEKKMY